MRSNRPTKAQQVILDKLAADDDAVIICDQKFGNVWWAGGEDIKQQVFDALIRRGWLASNDGAKWPRYRLSPAGERARTSTTHPWPAAPAARGRRARA